MIKLKAATLTQMGVKHIQNDDSAFVNEKEGVYIICDGVSEGGQGKLAAQFVTNIIQGNLIRANQDFKNRAYELVGTKRLQAMQSVMLETFTEAQTLLREQGEKNPLYKVASTTCITIWFNDRFAILGHLGDSRAYLYRAGKLYQLTKDHSGLDELVKMGMPLEIAVKSPLAKTLTRAVGNAQLSNPDILKIEFEPNDTLFLCTDGFYTALNTPQAMTSFVQDLLQGSELKPWIEKCAKLSGDDSTLIHIHFENEEKREEVTSTDIRASDRIHLIQQAPLAKFFDYVQQSHIAAICEIETAKAGDIVIKEGEDGDCMYIIAKGAFTVSAHGKFLKDALPGEHIGEVALIRNSKRTATVIAKENSALLRLKRSDLEEVFKKDPLIETRFYKATLDAVFDRLVSLTEQLTGVK